MNELRLIFVDDGGEERSATVTGESFVIGRHSSCDLTIPDGRLSREHLKIERFGDDYFASDLGSSNGSTLNGEELSARAPLNEGDYLLLGGGVEINVTFEAEFYIASSVEAQDDSVVADPVADAAPMSVPDPSPLAVPTVAAAAPSSSLPVSLFFIGPLLALFVLVLVGGLIYLMSDNKKTTIATNDFQYSTDDDDPPKNKKDDDPRPSNSVNVSTDDPTQPTSSPTLPSQTPSGEFAGIETSGTAFLRRIATNDTRAFLTGDQAKRVSAKVKQFSGSSALAANIESARKSKSQIGSLATAKNLKPQFLATAAIAKLGSTRGDVLQTATGMADILDKLGTHVGNELADDSLLMVAAYDQGVSGEFLKMRNQLQELANKYPESSRQIRTIWFLKEKNQISDSEFDRALTFLAIGVITQNPKAFGVNAEALLL
ncbi:MAG TPA: FHA domain-containing protein [Pyrinomonadaceae bacterium]|nr:FHA domain-containing protein [Pyrinomonadaceae bacterium]